MHSLAQQMFAIGEVSLKQNEGKFASPIEYGIDAHSSMLLLSPRAIVVLT